MQQPATRAAHCSSDTAVVINLECFKSSATGTARFGVISRTSSPTGKEIFYKIGRIYVQATWRGYLSISLRMWGIEILTCTTLFFLQLIILERDWGQWTRVTNDTLERLLEIEKQLPGFTKEILFQQSAVSSLAYDTKDFYNNGLELEDAWKGNIKNKEVLEQYLRQTTTYQGIPQWLSSTLPSF